MSPFSVLYLFSAPPGARAQTGHVKPLSCLAASQFLACAGAENNVGSDVDVDSGSDADVEDGVDAGAMTGNFRY